MRCKGLYLSSFAQSLLLGNLHELNIIYGIWCNHHNKVYYRNNLRWDEISILYMFENILLLLDNY